MSKANGPLSDRKGQVTILVIVGVIFVLLIIFFFFIMVPEEDIDNPPSLKPRVFAEKCIKQAVGPSVDSVFRYGGLTSPRHHTKRYDVVYNYLCFADDYYEKCINNYPMLNHVAEEEIRQDSVQAVGHCFDELIKDYESRGFDVESEELFFDVRVIPGNIRLDIKKPIQVSKGDSSKNFVDFDMDMPSDLYDIISVVRGIVNQEAQNCYFAYNGFMVMYPKYNITRIDYLESKLYEVQNRHTKERFRFAVRSCPYAPGVLT